MSEIKCFSSRIERINVLAGCCHCKKDWKICLLGTRPKLGGGEIVCKLNYQTFKSEFDSHLVPHL